MANRNHRALSLLAVVCVIAICGHAVGEETEAYIHDGIRYVGSADDLARLRLAQEQRAADARSYPVLANWREALLAVKVFPVIDDDITTGEVQATRQLESPRSRILMDQLWLLREHQDVDREHFHTYLKELLEAWKDLPGEDLILRELGQLHADEPESSLRYFQMAVNSRNNSDRWGLLRQYAWQEIARIHEAQGHYQQALAALDNWVISEPCGTGVASSQVRRFAWILRLRQKAGEDPELLKNEVWESVRTGSMGSAMFLGAIVDDLCHLYGDDLATLLADARATDAALEELAQTSPQQAQELYVEQRRENLKNITNEVALRQRLAGPQWQLSSEAAQQRQVAAAQALNVPVEREVIIAGQAMRFRLIPPGEFLIGKPESNEQDRVHISQAFYMGVFEVTQAQWMAVMGEHPRQSRQPPEMAQHPVDAVSWNDVVHRFLPKIEAFAPEGMRWDLPSEAQWEYACRAGTATAFHFGDTVSADLANIGDERTPGYRGHAMPVGSFPPNPWGLHDMHGNVEEWCRDAFRYNVYRSRNAIAIDPINEEGDSRVVRGGSFLRPSDFCSSANRSGRGPEHFRAGFRLVLVMKGPLALPSNGEP